MRYEVSEQDDCSPDSLSCSECPEVCKIHRNSETFKKPPPKESGYRNFISHISSICFEAIAILSPSSCNSTFTSPTSPNAVSKPSEPRVATAFSSAVLNG